MRAGNAGIVASFAISIAAIVIGAFFTYVPEIGSAARAERNHLATLTLREAPFDERFEERAQIVNRLLSGNSLERLPAPLFTAEPRPAPKIIIIFDDIGLDRRTFEIITHLPGPLTLSFLPYADNVDELARIASDRGDDVMLHLPMEPVGDADPGPNALRSDMTGVEFVTALDWNLSRIEYFVGVNNHMGSALTADRAAMTTVLAHLQSEGLFFLDSVTTPHSVARAAGAAADAEVFSRDVFLDADPKDKNAIREQLALAERIARETGYVVAICHPRKETLDVVGPWLVSAPARGFELAPVSALLELNKPEPLVATAAPRLRG
ncbi:MAG: divergent polysaccharide deacetylase family protein [Marinicaulis sp.]|nr:divergent polysaccharide deacetylase family protein [Marinicaulis sp.]NNL88446.1 divergent polysaccharide deacetylase family protein [Marinicaulis sp.]